MMIGIMWENKKGESLTLTRLINGLWRCPSIDVNVRSRDCHATDALRAISVWKLNMETEWVCIKLYNEKFPLVYESDNIGDSLYEKHGAIFKHRRGKDSNIVPSPFSFSFFLFLFFVGLFGLYPFFGASLATFILIMWQCSNNDDHHTFIYLQLNITTRY